MFISQSRLVIVILGLLSDSLYFVLVLKVSFIRNLGLFNYSFEVLRVPFGITERCIGWLFGALVLFVL
jgi:hypothetical protein